MISDTIAAIATSTAGVGAISIIRISGDDAFLIANNIFKGVNLLTQKSHTIHYGHIVDKKNDLMLDEVLVMLMRGPRSFTAEDVVEINCHGGTFVTKKILELILASGARHAHAGEFSKRAFLNGRVDLSEAEAIMDVIEAKSTHSLELALSGLDGRVRHLIEKLRASILNIVATIEVNIDYPEYDDVTVMTNDILKPQLTHVYEEMEKLLQTAHTGQLLKNGIKTAIIGRPNVGKSSLLNKLIREDKAIVTDIAGTTRDTVEAYVNIGGLTLNLIDTAGIRETTDVVEAIGVEKSKKLIEEAQLILLVLNANEPLSEEDLTLLTLTESKNRLILLNKSDLSTKIDTTVIPDYIHTSMIEETGIDTLESNIKTLFEINDIRTDETFISNARHIAKLEESKTAILNALTSLEFDTFLDMVELDIKAAWEILGEIIGLSAPDSLIDELFTKFCLGK